MGLFDYVHVNGAAYVCSEGHDLTDHTFQTKDLGCTMGDAKIGDVGSTVEMRDGGWGGAEVPGLTDYIHVYTDCERCPAFVQLPTGNVIDVWCEFKIHVVKDVVRSIERVSEPTAEFLVNTPGKPWMTEHEGPFSYDDALKRSREVWQAKAVRR